MTLEAGERIALDAAPLIYYIEAHPVFGPKVRPLLDEVVRGQRRAVASSLIITEILTLPPAQRTEGLEHGYRSFLSLPNLELIALNNGIAQKAAQLRMTYGLGTPDAVHVATALAVGASVFVTNDRRLKKILELTIVTPDDL